MKPAANHSLKTQRLLLTPVSIEDMALYEQLLSCPITTQFLPGGQPYSLSRIHHYVDNRIKHWQKHGFGTFTVAVASDPARKMGYAGVEHVADNPEYVDIRYGVLLSETGKGYAFEAASAVLKQTFATTALTEIYGVAVADNKASVHLLKKLGMQAAPTQKLYEGEGLMTFSVSR